MASDDEGRVELRHGERLSTDELMMVRSMYTHLRKSNKKLQALPASPSWLRFYKLNRSSTNRFGVCTFATAGGNARIGLHSLLFLDMDTARRALVGVVHHELCHFVAGFEAGHDEHFVSIERGWHELDKWRSEMGLMSGLVREFNASHHYDSRVKHYYSCPMCSKEIVKKGHPYYTTLRCRECALENGHDTTFIYMGESREEW